MVDAIKHRSQHDQPIRFLRELKRVDAERFVGHLLGLAARSRQQPNLHALVGIVVGLDFVRLAVRQKRKCAVAPETRRCVLAVTARQLRRLAAVAGYSPQVRNVLGTVSIEPLHGYREPGAIRRRRNGRHAPQCNVLFNGVGRISHQQS